MSTVAKQEVAADYMQCDIVTVSPDNTLRQALFLMTEHHVAGLPVVDDCCRCIGLITSSDILNYEQEHSEESAEDGAAQFFDPNTERWATVPHSAFGLAEFGDVRVSEVMTRELIWVDQKTPLTAVAQRMIEQRVHRVLVMDAAYRLYGILSAYDFVRVVAET